MANTKFTELTENTSRHFNDLLAMVDDPAGTPLSQKIKFLNATGLLVNAQTGTTYTYLTGDYGKLVTHTNGSAIAGTLPQAGAIFPANWFMFVQNRGAGAVTITPTTSTIDGAATLVLNQYEGALIVSDGTNYFTMRGKATVGSGDLGYINIPQNSQSADYTTVLADQGKHIYHPVADDNPRTFTIPANASVAYQIGTAITFVNDQNTITIAITSDTLVWAEDGSTGPRTLAENGVATAIKVTSTRWIISGVGLS